MDIPRCNVTPGLPRPRQSVDRLICSPILALVKDLSSFVWLLLIACAKDRYPLKNTKNSKSFFRAASTLEQL